MAARTKAPRPSEAIENYAKAIYALEQRGEVTNNALAERLGVTPASASSMVKKLDELGLVEHAGPLGERAVGGRKPVCRRGHGARI